MLEEETYIEIPSLEYLAGLFDGEGSIFLAQGKKYYYLRVGINITHELTPRLFHKCFGGNLGIIPPKGNSKQQWYWRAAGEDALSFLITIYPYLIIKRGQAELGIKFQERKKGWFHTDAGTELDNVDKRLMAILNKRGI